MESTSIFVQCTVSILYSEHEYIVHDVWKLYFCGGCLAADTLCIHNNLVQSLDDSETFSYFVYSDNDGKEPTLYYQTILCALV